jgi:hypothetical protein
MHHYARVKHCRSAARVIHFTGRGKFINSWLNSVQRSREGSCVAITGKLEDCTRKDGPTLGVRIAGYDRVALVFADSQSPSNHSTRNDRVNAVWGAMSALSAWHNARFIASRGAAEPGARVIHGSDRWR